VVSAELAGWQDMHEKMGRKAIRDLASGMLIKERTALEGMKRALRKLKTTPPTIPLEPMEFEVNGSSA